MFLPQCQRPGHLITKHNLPKVQFPCNRVASVHLNRIPTDFYFACVPVVTEVSLPVVMITDDTGYTELLLSCAESHVRVTVVCLGIRSA